MLKNHLNRVYAAIVGSNPTVLFFYSLYKIRHGRLHRNMRIISWIYLVFLLIKYSIFKIDAKKRRIYPESRAKIYPDLEKLAKRLRNASVVSFDVFDTLILRKTEKPSDLFDFIGYKLGVTDYKTIRMAAEREIRKRGEANLRSICDLLEKRYGIDAVRAYEEELNAERIFCYGNPYFLRLLERKEFQDKQIIAISDMYLPAEFIKELLCRSGYRIETVFVSCECGCSKANGGLWRQIRAKYGKKGFIHIGDDYCGDVRNCLKAGLRTIGIPNLTLSCKLYRDFGFYSAVRSLYSSLVSAKLHCTGEMFDPFYEHGYVYGGLLVYGFCSWLERLAKYRGYDCLIFLARDSELFYNVYRKYFGKIPSAYLYTSRFAALKLVLPKYFNIFVSIMFARKIQKKITIGRALEQAELKDLCTDLPKWGLTAERMLDSSALGRLTDFLYAHEKEIVSIYRGNSETFERYVAPVLEGKKRVCIIDLGWRGTIFSLLETYFRDTHPDIIFRSAMLGVTDSDMAGNLIDSGKMDSYLFSHTKNTNYMINEKQIMLIETMFSSESPTTQGYAVDDGGKCGPVFGMAEEADSNAFHLIRCGIYDFCEEFSQIVQKLPFEPQISGVEAYAPLAEMMSNIRYNVSLFGKLKTSADPNSEPITMRQLLDEVGYTSGKKKDK